MYCLLFRRRKTGSVCRYLPSTGNNCRQQPAKTAAKMTAQTGSHPRFEPTISIRGGGRAQQANSEQVGGWVWLVAPRGSRGRGDYRGVGTTVLTLSVLTLWVLYSTNPTAPSSSYNTKLLQHWVTTEGINPTVTTEGQRKGGLQGGWYYGVNP